MIADIQSLLETCENVNPFFDGTALEQSRLFHMKSETLSFSNSDYRKCYVGFLFLSQHLNYQGFVSFFLFSVPHKLVSSAVLQMLCCWWLLCMVDKESWAVRSNQQTDLSTLISSPTTKLYSFKIYNCCHIVIVLLEWVALVLCNIPMTFLWIKKCTNQRDSCTLSCVRQTKCLVSHGKWSCLQQTRLLFICD